MWGKLNKGIIISADVEDFDQLEKLLSICNSEETVGVKVGFKLALRYGLPEVVKFIRQLTKMPIIYDHQKAGTDIPRMGWSFAKVCKQSGVDGVIFFPHAGPITLAKFIKSAQDLNLEPIVGAIMTHDKFLISEGGFIDDEAPDLIFKISMDLGVKNYVLPGTKYDLTEKYTKGMLKAKAPLNILMPGIGIQGGSLKNAINAARPHNAFPIIGSSIYKSNTPKAELEKFIQELNS